MYRSLSGVWNTVQKWSRMTSVAIWPWHTGPRMKVRTKYSAWSSMNW
jgi:hypothetical protein